MLSDSEILKRGIDKVATDLSCAMYNRQYGLPITSRLFPDTDHIAKMWSFLWDSVNLQDNNARAKEYAKAFFRALELSHNKFERTLRLRYRIERMVTTSPKTTYFCTFTFSDDYLSRTTVEYRRTSIFRLLRPVSLDYVANIDFGARNHREHYHAVVCCKRDIDLKSYLNDKYLGGFFNVKPVGATVKDTKCLAKYIAKLTNHGIKDTTQSVDETKQVVTRMIYMRCPLIESQ